MRQQVTRQPRPSSFSPLAVPFTFMVNDAPEVCVKRLQTNAAKTTSWSTPKRLRGNWEQFDDDTWRVYLEKNSRWAGARGICYLKRDISQSTTVSGYADGIGKLFFFGAIGCIAGCALLGVVIAVLLKDSSWLEIPIYPIIFSIVNFAFGRGTSLRFITIVTATLATDDI